MSPEEARKIALEHAVKLNPDFGAEYIARFASVLSAFLIDGTVPAEESEGEGESE